jgi:DNA polymerase-2
VKILERTGLFRLAVERAALTGVSLDKAWTSVASFERVYAAELRSRGIAPAVVDPARRVSGASGGTVLDPAPGLFSNVAVFDFRSLYPTIIRTFNVDPLANRRAGGGAEDIVAPNGARFSRSPGILPGLIAGYFASRKAALAAGDEVSAFVYKILMNSFYGVLGTDTCRYARTELAGSITSFARKWLHFSRDWFETLGLRVLYGDTDSVFVDTGLSDSAGYEEFSARCVDLASRLNTDIASRVREEYSLESFMEIRFEKAYRRFLIPPLRAIAEDGVARGRAKGYAGSVVSVAGDSEIEVKGMEAIRSDVTAPPGTPRWRSWPKCSAGGARGDPRLSSGNRAEPPRRPPRRRPGVPQTPGEAPGSLPGFHAAAGQGGPGPRLEGPPGYRGIRLDPQRP